MRHEGRKRALARGTAMLSLVALAVMGCGGGGDGPTSTPPPGTGGTGGPGGPGGGTTPTASVTVTNNAFTPANASVASGTTVTWTWDSCIGDGYGGESCVGHNVTFDDGTGLASATLEKGSYNRRFNTPGTYNYHCTLHNASGMRGSVAVQ